MSKTLSVQRTQALKWPVPWVAAAMDLFDVRQLFFLAAAAILASLWLRSQSALRLKAAHVSHLEDRPAKKSLLDKKLVSKGLTTE